MHGFCLKRWSLTQLCPLHLSRTQHQTWVLTASLHQSLGHSAPTMSMIQDRHSETGDRNCAPDPKPYVPLPICSSLFLPWQTLKFQISCLFSTVDCVPHELISPSFSISCTLSLQYLYSSSVFLLPHFSSVCPVYKPRHDLNSPILIKVVPLNSPAVPVYCLSSFFF